MLGALLYPRVVRTIEDELRVATKAKDVDPLYHALKAYIQLSRSGSWTGPDALAWSGPESAALTAAQRAEFSDHFAAMSSVRAARAPGLSDEVLTSARQTVRSVPTDVRVFERIRRLPRSR